jgi:DNA-binding NarL/FixJ family response regulator
VRLTRRLKPDVLLLDLSLPGINGFDTTRKVKAFNEPPKVIIVSLHSNGAYRAMAREVGADGFISKDHFGDQVVQMLAETLPGGGSKPSALDPGQTGLS